MLDCLVGFRAALDGIMLKCMHDRIILLGDGYSGAFIKWYAEYYHGISVDYVVSQHMKFGIPHEEEVYQISLLSTKYKDAERCSIWVTEATDDNNLELLERLGYVRDKNLFFFPQEVYGNDLVWEDYDTDPFNQRKKGQRDVQLLEYLEWKYGCNFITAISKEYLDDYIKAHGARYSGSQTPMVMNILSRCHIVPNEKDAIFDFGCGKGSSLILFLDYGFRQVGGVEYDPQIYRVLVDNFQKLKLQNDGTELLCGDAANVTEKLDRYNYFYFYNPFDKEIAEKCLWNIRNSISRRKRKVYIIAPNPVNIYPIIKNFNEYVLTNQFSVNTVNRIVQIYESR